MRRPESPAEQADHEPAALAAKVVSGILGKRVDNRSKEMILSFYSALVSLQFWAPQKDGTGPTEHPLT